MAQFGFDRKLHEQAKHGPSDVGHSRLGGADLLYDLSSVITARITHQTMPVPLGHTIQDELVESLRRRLEIGESGRPTILNNEPIEGSGLRLVDDRRAMPIAV
jgi:hypothetical protein